MVPLSALLAKAHADILCQDLPHRFASNNTSAVVAELGAFQADTAAQALAREAQEVARKADAS